MVVRVREDAKRIIANLCLEISEQNCEDFLSRMDPEYFSLYSPDEIATHIKMSSLLDSRYPVQCKVISRNNGIFDIVFVAFDYFSEFSVLCGLLTSFGLDIQSGYIYTFSQRKGGAGSSARIKKILDHFRVRLLEGELFDEMKQGEFQKELHALILLLAQDQVLEARTRVNRRVVESLSRRKGPFVSHLYPVKIKFNNRLSETWTIMEIQSKDTPAFLYSFSNALSLRGIYIHKVKIKNIGLEVRDEFYLCDRQGRKIEGAKEQEFLKIATVMIKQFTHFLVWAPDPARAIRYFDQLMDKVMEKGLRGSVISFLSKKVTLDLLARLLGTSEFLWEDVFRIQFENLLPILRDFQQGRGEWNKNRVVRQLKQSLLRGRTLGAKKRILNDHKDRELFRIDMKHLLAPPGDLMVFSRAVTDLAEVVLGQAYEICRRYLDKRYGLPVLPNGKVCPFAILGLGKFGGREMGYASDIELLFVYGGPGRTAGPDSIENEDYFERLAQEIIDLIETRREGIFQIDVRLRPHGKAGVLASSMEQFRSYYSLAGGAAPFERQALIKLRWAVGNETLGRRVEDFRDSFVYSGQPWDLKMALHLRQRQMKELVNPGTINVKYGAGGVIDIEYAVQYLQIMHGADHPMLRTPSTLEALDGLCQARILSREECNDLRRAYLLLRTLIDALRIVRGNARDLVLPQRDSQEFKFLARRMGYTGLDWKESAEKLDRDVQYAMQKAHHFFTSRFKEV
jgi:glutamate-ammonia-ligase adenylyltransferase